ncbi:MAG TPA: adenylate cyclase regulatory domain-containing protein [Thermoleophilaceae bacterium]|nr:adenylate cyclase regulatory domain-containing protein [Thermoleophilaceae bacterium]
MPIDFAAEGLIDEAGDERSREARLELLRTLEAEGFGLEELRRAARDGRLTMLPVERVLAAEGPRYTQRELAEETGLDLDFMNEARRAVGAAAVDPDEPVLTEEDRELALAGAALLRSGLDRERFLELICVMSNLLRAGDWYGRPVNLAARLTEFARRGSVVASADVHDAAADGHSWSFAGRRRLKGVSDEIEVYRVRRPAATGSSRNTPRRASAGRPRT